MSGDAIPVRIDNAELAIETVGVKKRFGKVQALSGLDLTVPMGAFYVLVGPNGAGKSTALRLLMDIVRADEGEARVLGMDTRLGAPVRAQVGWVPESADTLYAWMRVGRLMDWHGSHYASWDAEYAARLARSLGLSQDRRYGDLSKGEKRRVQLLVSLAHRPHVLLLDEPTDGLDPAARGTALGILAEHMAESPCTVLVSTHLVHEMEGLADHLGVLRNGRIEVQVRREELDVQMRSYLFEAPEHWSGARRNGMSVVRGAGNARARRWMVWGDEERVRARLDESGASVREVSSVSLEEAAVALLMRDGASE